jgi:hypothetical protein
MSMHVVSQDHYMLFESKPGAYTLTEQSVGTRFALLTVRTLVDITDPEDIAEAHAAQDAITISGGGNGPFEAPEWDLEDLKLARQALSDLGTLGFDTTYAFGTPEEVRPIDHLVAAGAGWGGLPPAAAYYAMGMVDANDGKTPHAVTVKDVPVDAFWSITVYNADGYLEANDLGINNYNNFKATPNEDESYTIHFGACDDGRMNCIPTTPGWNYVVRLYQPREEIIDGSWSFPNPVPLQGEMPEVFADGADARFERVDNVHQVRFIEIFLTGREASTGNIVAAVYNTMYTPKGIPTSKDTAPQALIQSLDFDLIGEEYGVLGASLNGPKLCLPDWVEIDVGVQRDFDGVTAAWVAQLNLGNSATASEKAPYKPTTIARDSGLGWNKGRTVILLDDAENNTWIMKGFELGLEPQYTYEEFLAAVPSVYQKLPEGWKVRVKTLEEDLIEKPEGGVATIMPDEFFNVYDKTGPGMTNYKP